MVTEKYACAYKEVIEILKYTNREDVNKIPSEKILLWKNNMKENHEFSINEEKPLSEQNISKETRAILANIFKDFWATDYQKERIEAKEKYDLNQIERERQEKYNTDNLFKNKNDYFNFKNIESNISTEISMTEYKEKNFIQRLFDKIKNLFRKN